MKINLTNKFPKSKLSTHIAGQILRCSTGAAANYAESIGAESRNDFIQKIKVSLKELRETKVWLLIVAKSKLMQLNHKLEELVDENDQLIAIFVASIKTANKK